MERWKRAHYAYYLAQKRRLAARPEYLAHRREMYRAKRSKTQSTSLSTSKSLHEYQETYERSHHGSDCQTDGAEGPQVRHWTDSA